MTGVLVIIVCVVLIVWCEILDIVDRRGATLFSRATYNKEKHQRKIQKQVRTTVKKAIRKKVNEAVKQGIFEFRVFLNWDIYHGISNDEVEDIINKAYDGQVVIEGFEPCGAGSRVKLKIVK